MCIYIYIYIYIYNTPAYVQIREVRKAARPPN